MNELYLITKREYLTRINKKSFIVLTILMPFLIIGSILLPLYLSTVKNSEPKHIAVVDSTHLYGHYLESDDFYIFENMDEKSTFSNLDFNRQSFAVLYINTDLSLDPKGAVIYSESRIPQDLLTNINTQLSDVVKQRQIRKWCSENNINVDVVSQLENQLNIKDLVNITTVRIDNDGAKETSTFLVSAIGLGLTFFMYFFILMYGTMVINGVVEEKCSRIVEVLVSTVSPFNLMMGKIIGIGLTGLTQFFLWLMLALLAIVGSYSFTDSIQSDVLSNQVSAYLQLILSINWFEIIFFFLLLFIGGYLMYASLFAMFGAAVDNAQDTQQFVMPITILFIFALYAALYSLENPDGPLAFWCSIVPFTSPVVMMVRIPFGVPLWEKLLSVVLLYVTIIFMVRFAARIYRIGILMYGKKATIRDLFKWYNLKK